MDSIPNRFANDMMNPQYPFTAVCGQCEFKLALMLAAVNPAIGGVVISGPRGSAKSTLARGMADLLDNAAFVTLPLGASEDMLLGTLDLEQVLNDKKMQFSPGLLSKAHQGVLYVDEVNLLADHLVDLLLDVSTSGVNCVERDGISHRHPAEFILVGTMNPDEGELRPQLHDRFGLSVQLTHQLSAVERVEIVKRREHFETEPQTFLDLFQAEQQALIQKIQAARSILSMVICSDELRLTIAERCEQAQVDGVRADIVWFRAAKAHAALQGRSVIGLNDINAVEELVLNHRRRVSPPPSPPSDNTHQPPQNPPQQSHRQGQGFKRPETSKSNATSNLKQQQTECQGAKENDVATNDTPLSSGEWGAMQPEQQKTVEASLRNFGFSMDKLSDIALKPASRVDTVRSSAATKKSRLLNQASHKPDWFKTLMNSLPSWPPAALRFQRQRHSNERLHLVLLDTSASTLQGQSFGYSKAALLQVSDAAYIKREKLAVFGFGNNQVKPLLSSIRAPKVLQNLAGWAWCRRGNPNARDVCGSAALHTTFCKQTTRT